MINSYNINYIDVIGENFTTMPCYARGEKYSDIMWNGATPISQDALDALILAAVKRERILDLSDSAHGEIISGFLSNALGSGYYYDSDQEDQLNLIGAVASGASIPFSCRQALGGAKQYMIHTAAQLLQVLNDGKNVKLAVLQKFSIKKDIILAASDIIAVEAITWESIP